MADQFLQMALVEDAAQTVSFEPHVLPVGQTSRSRAAAVYEWTPVDTDNPGSAEGLGVGPLQWRITGPVVLGSRRNPKLISPEGLRRWAMLETWVGQDVTVFYGSFAYGTWVIKDANMEGDVIAPIPDYDDAGAVRDWWHSHIRHRWRMNLVQKEPPATNDELPALYGGLVEVSELPTVTTPTAPVDLGDGGNGGTPPVTPPAATGPTDLFYYWTGVGAATLRWVNGNNVETSGYVVQAFVSNAWLTLTGSTTPALGSLSASGEGSVATLTGVTDGLQLRVRDEANSLAASITVAVQVPEPSGLAVRGSGDTWRLLWTPRQGTRHTDYEFGAREYDSGNGTWFTWNMVGQTINLYGDVSATLVAVQEVGDGAEALVRFQYASGTADPGAGVVQLRTRASVPSQGGGYETPWVAAGEFTMTPSEGT